MSPATIIRQERMMAHVSRLPSVPGLIESKSLGVKNGKITMKPTIENTAIQLLRNRWLVPMSPWVSSGNSPASASFSKIGSNCGTKNSTSTLRMMNPATARKIGIRHGPDHLGAQVFLLLGELGDAFQHVLEEAAFLAGPDHADDQFAEGPRMLGQGVGQVGTVGDLFTHLAENSLRAGCALWRSRVSMDRSSGTPARSRSASWAKSWARMRDLILFAALPRLGRVLGGFDAHGEQAAGIELRNGVALAVGGQRAAVAFAGSVQDFVGIIRHGSV